MNVVSFSLKNDSPFAGLKKMSEYQLHCLAESGNAGIRGSESSAGVKRLIGFNLYHGYLLRQLQIRELSSLRSHATLKH